jgi:tetratricopeptide (TPR) repeat protein
MATVVTSWNGAKASALRVALRLTMDELAARIGGSPRGVAKWDHQPDLVLSMASQRDLDHVLTSATPDEQARFAMLVEEHERSSMTGLAASGARGAAELGRGPSEGDVSRATELVVPLNGNRGVLTAPTAETLAWFEQNLRNQYTADNLLGPRALMPLMTSYVATIEQMQQSASGAVLDRLLRIGAGYAEFTGWLHHDAGDLRGATTWVTRALEWAQGGVDERMTSFVLMRRAAAALTARSGPYAVRLAQAAQRFKSAETGRVRIIAAVTEAHGHAIAGDGSEVDRTFDTAAALLERYGEDISDGDPTADRYCEPALYVKIARAKCALELGRAGDAVEAFTDVIDSLPPDYHRDRGQYLGSLARAQILAEQPEAATVAAEEAFNIAIATGSTRTVADLRGTMPSGLAPWSHIPEVDRFCAMLAAVEPEIGGN